MKPADFNINEPSSVLRVVDCLRTIQPTLRCGIRDAATLSTIDAEVHSLVHGLADAYMWMVVEHAGRSTRIFNNDYLLRILIMSGLLKNSAELTDALLIALSSSIANTEQVEYWTKMLRTDHKPPSSTVLYRHRFMFLMAYNALLASERDIMLASGSIVRWATMDGSPQGGWDWLMHGGITMTEAQCRESFDDALCYIRLSRRLFDVEELSSGDRYRLQTLRDQLARVLIMILGMPAAVGSGRSGVRNKLHAAVHSERMTSSSWAAAAQCVSSTFLLWGIWEQNRTSRNARSP